MRKFMGNTQRDQKMSLEFKKNDCDIMYYFFL